MTNSKYRYLAFAGLFAALTAAGAFIQVPLGFTSITLQTMITILAGALLGAKWGTLSQVTYVVLGLVGLPVFTKGGGLGYLLQPSMGFLLALIPAAFVVGKIMESGAPRHSMKSLVVACIAAEIVIYLIGTPYMGAVLNLHMGLGYSAAKVFQSGCLLYLPGDLVKVIIVLLIYKPLVKALTAAGLL